MPIANEWEFANELMEMDPRSTQRSFWSHWEALEWPRMEVARRLHGPEVYIAIVGGRSRRPLILRSWRECRIETMHHMRTAEYQGFQRRWDAEQWLETKIRRGGA